MTKQITLATLHKATEQQVFNQAARHMLTQRRKSMNGGKCAYRSKSGKLKCVAGCFIADKEYNPSFEGAEWWTLADDGLVPEEHCELISSLQGIHDSCPARNWADRLLDLAEGEGLRATAVTNFQQAQR